MVSTKTLIRKGQLTLIPAGPGTGKSAIVQTILQRGDDRGNLNTAIYFSADSDPSTMFKRAAAIHSGWEQSAIEDILTTGDSSGIEAAVKAATSHIRWDFNSSPSEEYILRELEAYAATFGAWPDVAVVDNVKNVDIGTGEGEFGMLEQTCVFLHQIARDTNMAVIALHHVNGEFENGVTPIPLNGVRGKITKTPEVVLTLHRSDDGTKAHISPVKNRNGKADASGRWFLPINVDMARMSFTG
ncbi:DnaB-like helicase C-terminal domain-containing protein [Arthrobacter sp. ISL-95]|uniref:DnaB-like helicase C-terminal domain-containing protein n=1 Tax=Arthrobacter sp. ISL-95 TaxID=2819116 RepID=UPI001BEAB519|nr:DnaB-like helicase C-terminal domain-containing protein [Arthrobacter sp. ISL-95]MBT2587983.1 hypothetical protein [Arthrobacter sp. ISL-95]